MKKFVYGQRQCGKSEIVRIMTEKLLDAGIAVIMPDGSARGAGVARDVTNEPLHTKALPKIEEHPE